MKKPRRIRRRQAPGPDYQFTLDDLQRMVEQLGGRFSCQIYPKELDDVRQRSLEETIRATVLAVLNERVAAAEASRSTPEA